MAVVEFIMFDVGVSESEERDHLKEEEQDVGEIRVEDCMEIIMRRYGMPSDYVFSKIFGNSFDPDSKVSFLFYWNALMMMATYCTSKRGIK
mmetsp:Transcript_42852/g.135084  ORF Transcript_42852/g.135084 Transcript_42852/m.135084 type:complete len:91 (+) Transcript_42852:1312-1584(+)